MNYRRHVFRFVLSRVDEKRARISTSITQIFTMVDAVVILYLRDM